jgi:hypothetical protein
MTGLCSNYRPRNRSCPEYSVAIKCCNKFPVVCYSEHCGLQYKINSTGMKPVPVFLVVNLLKIHDVENGTPDSYSSINLEV